MSYSRFILSKIFFSLIISCFSISYISAAGYKSLPVELDGTMMPYDFSKTVAVSVPDSLMPFHIEYVARHGARFLSSATKVEKLKARLDSAAGYNQLTPHGIQFLSFLNSVNNVCKGNWGMLSEVGEEEEMILGGIMAKNWGALVGKGPVKALSTYVPRVVATMNTFTSTLNTLKPGFDLYTSSGPVNSPLLRFFDTDQMYYEWLHPAKDHTPTDSWKEPLSRFEEEVLPTAPAARLFKNRLPKEDLQKISAQMYGVLQGLRAMSFGAPTTQWMSVDEYRACWECTNAEHYLKRSLSSVSNIPMKGVMPLLIDIISNADKAATTLPGETSVARLMFGHAETLLPLAALMNLPGAAALPIDLSQLASQWKDYEVTPLGANILLVLARNSNSGIVYALVSLNGTGNKWVQWSDLRAGWLERIASLSYID